MDNTEQSALDLWKRWFDENEGNPIYASSHVLYCFFCGEYQTSAGGNNHTENCIYLQAKELVTNAKP